MNNPSVFSFGSSKTIHNLICFQGYFWDLQSKYKNKHHVGIFPKRMHSENSSDSLEG